MIATTELRARAAVIVCVVLLVAVAAAPAAAYPRPGQTEPVSVAFDGAEVNGGSSVSAVSADGRYVALQSYATNLVPGITNTFRDVFVHDRETGETERVSVASDGAEANHGSGNASISADGRYVAFESLASNLVPGDTNGVQDIFVHDRKTKVTERVSVASDGTQAIPTPRQTAYPSISADGRYVAFMSDAPNLVPGDTNNRLDVFVHDRVTGETERVSLASDGTQGNADSYAATLSGDGRHVAFYSSASNLVPGDTNDTIDVFVHDRETGSTERVSMASDGTQGDSSSVRPTISADGRHVAFYSAASTLVPADTNNRIDVFVHDRETAETERVSVAGDGAQSNGWSSRPQISADGRYVVFDSLASNLAPGDTNDNPDVFVHDRETKVTERVSIGTDGTQGRNTSWYSAVSADGRYAAFEAGHSNFIPGSEGPMRIDVFVRDRGPAVGVGGLAAAIEGDSAAVSGWATFSGQVVTAAAAPADSGALGAHEAGAELTGASLTYRAETEDLLLRLRLGSLPASLDDDGAGHPTVLYGLRLDVGGGTYEVRALRSATAGAAPVFVLYRCDPVCTEQAPLSGGIGTTGTEVRVGIPLAALGAAEGTALSGLLAFTALGEAALGRLVALDEVELPDATIPTSQVSLGIAPADASEAEVVFATEAVLADGVFSGAVDASSLVAGDYQVWARACLGDVCGAHAARVEL